MLRADLVSTWVPGAHDVLPAEATQATAGMIRHFRVLIAVADLESQRTLGRLVADCGLQPIISSSLDHATAILAVRKIALVFCAADLLDATYRDLLHEMNRSQSLVPVVLASRLGEWGECLEAMQLGAADVIAPPFRLFDLERVISNALRESSRPPRALPAKAS